MVRKTSGLFLSTSENVVLGIMLYFILAGMWLCTRLFVLLHVNCNLG